MFSIDRMMFGFRKKAHEDNISHIANTTVLWVYYKEKVI
jgi:hypothetical protein